MKTFFFILIFFVSCTLTPSTGYDDSLPATVVDPEIAALKTRVTDLEKKQSALSIKFSKDSLLQWATIKAVTPLVPEVKQLTLRYTRDSARQWVYINSVLPLIGKMAALTTRYTRDSTLQWVQIKAALPIKRYTLDSTNQWVAIKKLQGASPVTQIPVMQADIKAIKSKNLSQDKILVAQSALIKNLYDTVDVYKVDAGSDFALDSNRSFQISPAGIQRIKESMPLP